MLKVKRHSELTSVRVRKSGLRAVVLSRYWSGGGFLNRRQRVFATCWFRNWIRLVQSLTLPEVLYTLCLKREMNGMSTERIMRRQCRGLRDGFLGRRSFCL